MCVDCKLIHPRGLSSRSLQATAHDDPPPAAEDARHFLMSTAQKNLEKAFEGTSNRCSELCWVLPVPFDRL